MKKIILIAVIATAIFACNPPVKIAPTTSGTVYVHLFHFSAQTAAIQTYIIN